MIYRLSLIFMMLLLGHLVSAQDDKESMPFENNIFIEGTRIGGALHVVNSPEITSIKSTDIFGVSYGLVFEHKLSGHFGVEVAIRTITEEQDYVELVSMHQLYGEVVSEASITNNYFSYALTPKFYILDLGKTAKINLNINAGFGLSLNHLINADIKGTYYYSEISNTEKFDITNNELSYYYVSNLSLSGLLEFRLNYRSFFITNRNQLFVGYKLAPENLKVTRNYALGYFISGGWGIYF